MLTRSETRKIFESHRGEITALARRIKKTRQSVTDVIEGKKTSRFILAAAIQRAEELIQEEEAESAVA